MQIWAVGDCSCAVLPPHGSAAWVLSVVAFAGKLVAGESALPSSQSCFLVVWIACCVLLWVLVSFFGLFLGLSFLAICPFNGLAPSHDEGFVVRDALGSPTGGPHLVQSDCLFALPPSSHACVTCAYSGRAVVRETGLLHI